MAAIRIRIMVTMMAALTLMEHLQCTSYCTKFLFTYAISFTPRNNPKNEALYLPRFTGEEMEVWRC